MGNFECYPSLTSGKTKKKKTQRKILSNNMKGQCLKGVIILISQERNQTVFQKASHYSIQMWFFEVETQDRSGN